jgi:hypothetical protein
MILTLGLALTLSAGSAGAQETPADSAVWAPYELLVAPTGDYTPLQVFATRSMHQVNELSRQIQMFRDMDQENLTRVWYHLIRDHVLLTDAAQNVLARQGRDPMPAVVIAWRGDKPEEILRHEIAENERWLNSLEQVIARDNPPEARGIYQSAARDARKHLRWLRSLDQGQQVAVGYFGPTVPLARIAGYREVFDSRQ